MKTLTGNFIDMIYANQAIVMDTKLTEKDFQGIEQDLFTAMKRIALENGIVDFRSLKDKGIQLADIANLDASVNTSGWRYREKQIIESVQKNKIRLIAEQIVKESSKTSTELIELFNSEVTSMGDRTGFEIRYLKDTLMEQMEGVLLRGQNKQELLGFSSGIKGIDYCTLGWQKRKLYFIGARPSQGKTALILNFACKVNACFGLISAESGQEEVNQRLLAINGNLDARQLAVGTTEARVFDSMSKTVEQLGNKNPVIYDQPNLNIDKLRMVANTMVKHMGVKIIFIDYIQIVGGGFSSKGKTKRENVIDVSMQLKQLARELNIPIVCTAQLNRDSDGDRPTLKNFSESSQIEQDADVAILIWRYKEKDTEEDKTTLIIEKNRDGMKADVKVHFNPLTLTFT